MKKLRNPEEKGKGNVLTEKMRKKANQLEIQLIMTAIFKKKAEYKQ